MTVFQLATKHGVKPSTAYARIRRGWNVKRACTTKARPYFYEWSAHVSR